MRSRARTDTCSAVVRATASNHPHPPTHPPTASQNAQAFTDLGLAAGPLLGDEPSIIIQAFLRDLSALAAKTAKRLASGSKTFRRPVGRPATRKRQRASQSKPKCVPVLPLQVAHLCAWLPTRKPTACVPLLSVLCARVCVCVRY